MAAPLIVRLIMDAAQYLKTQDTATASTTKFVEGQYRMGEAVAVTADKQVAASLKATKALETQIAAQRALAADTTKSAKVRTRANLLADRSQARLNSSLGLSSAAFAGSSQAVKTGERDLGKFTRGALAGSGAASSLGRSLAFASTGFIAIAGGATLIAASIKAAITLQKTQRQVDRQLQTGGKSWVDYGQQIEQADLRLSHVSGFTNQELLQSFTGLFRVTNNVSRSLQLNAVAADVARGRNISLASASNALAKAAAGSFSSLRKLNIIVPKGATVLQALTFVAQKYAGQAAAGATVSDKFHAALVNTEEAVGGALLPAFTRATTAITDWLAKMTESGRIQHDLNDVVGIAGGLFHFLGGAIGYADKVTGSFGNTLKLLVEVYLLRKLVQGTLYVDKLAASWAGVAAAANTATAAEERATAVTAGAGASGLTGAAVGADAGLIGGLAARRAAQRAVQSEAAVSRISQYTGTLVPAEEGVAAIGAGAVVATSRLASLRGALLGLVGKTFITTLVLQQVLTHQGFLQSQAGALGGHLGANQPNPANPQSTQTPGPLDFFTHPIRTFFTSPALNDAASKSANQISDAVQKQIARNLSKGHVAPSFFPKNLQFAGVTGARTTAAPPGPFGTATPIAVYAKYTQTITEQLSVAQAALTKTTKDDVAAAKRIIARIKSQIDKGHLEGASLIQALQDEATQQGVLDNARQAAAAQAAKIAAAKKAAASSYTTPIDLQLAEARAQLTKSTADDIAAEKAILAAAKAAVASGKKNKQGQLAAIQIELQAKQALDSLQTQSATTFTQSPKLQLALAKAQALGTDQTGILLKMKAALERALKNAKGNIQKQIDIWNQIAAINQQLGSSASGLLGGFKQASTKVLTQGLGLNAAQRKALRERLSQLGPGGTVPGNGVGAGGFIIGPDGRPVQAHQHRQPRHGRTADAQTASPARLDHLLRVLEKTADRPIHLTVELDRKVIADATTREQQRRHKRNPGQRRGPNAGRS